MAYTTCDPPFPPRMTRTMTYELKTSLPFTPDVGSLTSNHFWVNVGHKRDRQMDVQTDCV